MSETDQVISRACFDCREIWYLLATYEGPNFRNEPYRHAFPLKFAQLALLVQPRGGRAQTEWRTRDRPTLRRIVLVNTALQPLQKLNGQLLEIPGMGCARDR